MFTQVNLRVHLIEHGLHCVDVRFGHKFVQQGIARLIANLVLNGNERILEVHYGAVKTERAFWGVHRIPTSLKLLLLPLLLGF